MKKKAISKVLAVIMSLAIVVSFMPMPSSAAYNANYESTTHKVFKHTESKLAPGISQYINYAYNKDGKQMVYYIATADLNNEDVVVKTSYKDQYSTEKFGMTKLSNQMEYATDYYSNEEKSGDKFVSKYYNTVAGINASFYNMSTGQPSGRTVLDGVSIGEGSYGGFFAILDDGSAVIMKDSGTENWKSVKDHVVQAIGGESVFILDGKCVTPYTGYCDTQYPHSAIGITADNEVVICTVDGNQEPFSIGTKGQGLADIMLEAGCVAALSLDGGGSATYAAKAEGEDKVSVINRPSDGSERSISAGVIFGSTTAPTNAFDHVSMNADDLYLMPGASTEIKIKGVSAAGTTAEVPADIVYECDNGALDNGTFTAGDIAKDTTIYAKLNGETVGSVTVHVVIPTSISFSGPQVASPYGKQVKIKVVPKYKHNDIDYSVAYNETNIGFDMTEGYGSIDGFIFTATSDRSITAAGSITAYVVNDKTIKATVPLKVGKESEVIFDFEKNLDGWGLYDYYDKDGQYGYTTHTTFELADNDNGKVHSGDHSLAVHLNFDERLLSGGYDNMALTYKKDQMKINTDNSCIDVTGATEVGFWMYLPEGVDAYTLKPRLFFGSYNGTSWSRVSVYPYSTTLGEANPDKYKEGGWFYFNYDVSAHSGAKKLVLSSMSSDRPATFGSLIELYASDYLWENKALKNVMPELTVYIDDLSVDYSTVKPDRNGPVFSNLTYACEGMADAQSFTDNVVATNSVVSFAAKVEDYNEDNAVGLDTTTGKIYIDGYEIGSKFSNGKLAASDVSLTNGLHSVKFEMSDVNGNKTTITKNIKVNATESTATAYVKAKDTSISKIKAGSLYYIDIVSTDIANTKAIDVSMKVTSTNEWEPKGIIASEGFKCTSSYDAIEKIVTIHAEKTGKVTNSGEATVFSVPVRAWYWDGSTSTVYNTAQKAYNSNNYMPIDIQVFTKSGSIIFDDNSTSTFAGSIKCDHEIDGKADDTTLTSCWHVHDAKAIADKAASCTEDGYTGRTYCEGCDSIVDFGTEVPAIDHNYELVDGVLKCTNDDCDETFTGTWTDGKEYLDGVILNGEVNGKYYVDGILYSGVRKEDDVYYEYTDGVKEGKYNGFVENGGKIYYSRLGVLIGGWVLDEENWYYFNEETLAAYDGKYTNKEGVTFEIEDGQLKRGVWQEINNHKRYWYGPDYYKNTSKNVPYVIKTIEGKEYLFSTNGYVQTGMVLTHRSNESTPICYSCDKNGAATLYTGVYGDYYFMDGERSNAYQIINDNGDFYYVGDGHKVVKNKTVYLSKPIQGFTYADGTPLVAGYFTFGADGKMEIKNGVYGDYLYKNNVRQSAYQMVQIGEDFYYVGDGHKIVKNKTLYLSSPIRGLKYTDGTPLEAGYYTFGDDGKLIK